MKIGEIDRRLLQAQMRAGEAVSGAIVRIAAQIDGDASGRIADIDAVGKLSMTLGFILTLDL